MGFKCGAKCLIGPQPRKGQGIRHSSPSIKTTYALKLPGVGINALLIKWSSFARVFLVA